MKKHRRKWKVLLSFVMVLCLSVPMGVMAENSDSVIIESAEESSAAIDAEEEVTEEVTEEDIAAEEETNVAEENTEAETDETATEDAEDDADVIIGVVEDDAAADVIAEVAAASVEEDSELIVEAEAEEEATGLKVNDGEAAEKVTIDKSGDYTITGSTTVGEDATAAITVESGVEANITLSSVNITVQGETGKHKAAIYVKDGATVTLTLTGTNTITGVVVDATGEVISTGVIGICIGGAPADSASSSGGTSVTVNGRGSLAISTVGTGISLTTGNKLTIDGTSLSIDDVYMMDTTISGIGIYSNGELVIQNDANVSISDVNLQNQSGTHISYNNGYGIDSQNGGTITITGSSTVNITDCYKAGIYSSHYKTDEDGSTTYSGNSIEVSNGAALNISVANTSLTSASGIRMENHGAINVSGNASLNVNGFTHWGITIGYEGTINVSGSDSAINLVGTSGTHTSSTVGIYAERDVRIDIDDSAEVNIDNVTGRGIDFEKGTNGTDGVYVSNGTLNITNAGAGIYVMGGTTNIEFTEGALVYMDVTGNCVGSDSNSPTGHVLMSGEGTDVDLNGGYVFALNYKYLEIADQAVVSVTAKGDAISLGNWSDGGASLVVTGDAKLTIESGTYTGIATYGSSHYVEISNGGIVKMSGEEGTAISLSKPTELYVSDATLLIENTDGIVASSTGILLYEDSLSHIEATNIYSTGDGDMDFIVMGGTLTYNFNHDDNIWPYNATDISIGEIADSAFAVNTIAVDREFTYEKDEALVNFIVPSDADHLTFDAMYQSLDGTYSYESDAAKEADTLSIWVPGVEVFYYFDEDTKLDSIDLTEKYVSDLEEDTSLDVDFSVLYSNTTEPYDMVIRGKSISFSEKETGNLTYAHVKKDDGTITDHVLEDKDGVDTLYSTAYTASDGCNYTVMWYYGENSEETTVDETSNNGALAEFTKDSNVVRVSIGNAYSVLIDINVTYVWVSTDNPTDVTTPGDDTIKSGTAYDSTPQDETTQGYTFAGWYLDEECTIPYVDGTVLTEDTILYGKWVKVTESDTTPDDTDTTDTDKDATVTSSTETTSENASATSATNTKTGDTNTVIYWVIVLAAAACVVVISVSRKRKHS